MSGGPDGPGPHLTGVTRLPSAVGAAATWDPATVKEFGAVTGKELAGKGVNVELGPTVNIVRDPRWGRAFESYGEDPYLSGQVAVADIEGVQSQGPIAMVKHFALYNQETYRNTAADDVIVSDRVAHEIYMPQFQAAVHQGGAEAVMCSYSTINGVDACQDPYLTRILDGQWDFSGFVMSDGGATHSTVAAANAGLDDMESRGGQHFGTRPGAGRRERPGGVEHAQDDGYAGAHDHVRRRSLRPGPHRLEHRPRVDAGPHRGGPSGGRRRNGAPQGRRSGPAHPRRHVDRRHR